MALLPREKKRTEVFVCDHCGLRKRLPRDQRHWCDNCDQTPPVELRLTRSRLHYHRPTADAAKSEPVQSHAGVGWNRYAR